MKYLVHITRLALALAAACWQAPAGAETVAAVQKCQPGAPCAHTLPVRIVVVTMLVGRDSGDAPGEFQFWKERRHFDNFFNGKRGGQKPPHLEPC